ncbi:hypothetical protein [Myxacorys almedinensis]|nr:hypothetical protein [Myxacorys almedinensis]
MWILMPRSHFRILPIKISIHNWWILMPRSHFRILRIRILMHNS